MFSAMEIVGIALFALAVVAVGVILYRLDNAMTNLPPADTHAPVQEPASESPNARKSTTSRRRR